MPNLKSLRANFDRVLKETWEEWDQVGGNPKWSPFSEIQSIPELDESVGFNYQLGWLDGISSATGWPLDRPVGPKEWSPKGKHPKVE